MIKKFIFSLAIILSSTIYHAVGTPDEDDELDASKISVQPGKLDKIVTYEFLSHSPIYPSADPVYLDLGTNSIGALEKQLRDLLFIVSLD
ncbi:MAG: hypothetical protein JNJ47_02480 [Alphaproteobacteria bacterium]|nr:hypothetical protein [Alphaproteobacteria bacterium]